MPLTKHEPFWPETAILLGAGATASLDIPTTDKMGETIHKLTENKNNDDIEERINDASVFYDIKTELGCFLKALEDNLREDGIIFDNESIKAARQILPDGFSEDNIKKKILQWKAHYDWAALCCLATKVPIVNNNYSTYLMDLYNIIDGSLLSNHGLQMQDTVTCESVFLYPHRLRTARNLLVLLSNLMMACAYHKKRVDSPDDFGPYIDFVKTLDKLNRCETTHLQDLEYNKRDFYLMSYSIISFNFDPIFLWFRFYQNAESNKNPPNIIIGKRSVPVESHHDFAVFTAIQDRKNKDLSDKYYPSDVYYPVNETVSNHVNRREDCSRLYRICKFYFVHGSTNIRECENCGKMMIILGDWIQMPEDLFSPPPFKTNLFKRKSRTKEEKDAYKEGKYDFVPCPYCGNATYAYNNVMIMQTAYKGGHASFLEEIQRDAKVSLSGAKHIILMGYQLPPDDAVWRSAIVAKQNNKKVYCSVVVGCSGERKWIQGEELIKYIKEKKKTEQENWAGYGVNAIEAAVGIFGKDNVRAYTGGIPQVWCLNGTVDKDKVKDLLYPSNVFPHGVANMRIENNKKV